MRAKPTAIQYNMCLHLCQILNQNSGRLACDEAMYYDFLDAYRVTHEAMLKAIQICNPLFRECRYPYIHIRSEKESGHADGEFYLTKSGLDWAKNLPMSDFPAYVELPKEEKPPISREELHTAFNPEPPKPKKEKPIWTKEEVIHLMTNEAHVVGHMLGTGYDLLEEIHSTWINGWILNPYDLRVAIHQAHRDSYKCFAPNTMVMMFDGTSKPIKDIKIGESVMGWDSTPRKVIGTHSGNTDLYKVTLKKNGESYICNKNHILTLKQIGLEHNKRHKFDKYRIEGRPDIIDIPISDFVKLAGIGDQDAFSHFKVGVDFAEQKTNIPPYILGLWLGDGHSNEPAFTTADEILHVEFKQWAESLGLHEKVYQKEGSKCKTYKYNGKLGQTNPINKLLRQYDLLGNKHIPHEYLQNSRKNRLALLAGLIDTDGYHGIKHYVYTTKNDKLAKDVEWLARSLGFNATAKKHKTSCIYNGTKVYSEAWQVYINGADFSEIPIKIDYKKGENKGTKGHLIFNQTIEPIGKGDFVGIEIEGDGKFLLENFLVVHNTTCLRLFIAEMMLLQPLTTIVLLRKSEDAVKEVVNGVSKILDTPLFQTFAAILYPDVGLKGGLKKTTDTALAIDTNLNTSLSGEFQLRALGLGSPLTGKHAKIIITDDIVTTDDRESEAERKNTIAKYQELMNVLSNNKGFSDTRIINIGTPWHEEDAFKLMERGLKPKNDNYKHYEEMLEDPKFSEKRKAHFREMIRKLDMQRGKSVYNCYQTGLMTNEDIEWKKQVLNDDVLFAANYLLSLVSDDEKPFKRINNVGNYSLAFFADCWEVIGHIDCAYGGDDSTSLSLGGFDYDNFNTVVYGRRWDKIPIDKNYLEVAEILWSCGCTKLWLEKNADKGLMGDKFRELGFDVESYHESMNKHTKIVSTIRPFWRESGNEVLPCVQFVEETDPNYLSQIYDYKKGVAHDDCPDNLACLLIKAKFGNLAVRIT